MPEQVHPDPSYGCKEIQDPLLSVTMVRQAFKIPLAVVALSCLTFLGILGWHRSWPTGVAPKRFRAKYIPTKNLFEKQASFDTIRVYLGALSPNNDSSALGPSRTDVHNITVPSDELHDMVKLDVASAQAQGPFAKENATQTKMAVKTERCSPPKNNILFFKMHKCSSSTIQNILMRYGDIHDLNFVLPPRGNYLGHSAFTPNVMLKFPVAQYNILCHHTRFSYDGMSKVMPKNTVWTTIIREPVGMFESTFYYRNLGSAFRINSPDQLATFANDPQKYVSKYGQETLARDPMMFDLGLSNSDKGNIKAINKLIAHLDQSFDLVLITEYIEESLVLLRDIMCWETDDIVSFVVNARAASSVHSIREDARRKLIKWNVGDVMLYDHFNKTFWKKVGAYGAERMQTEVALLKERNKELKDKCILDPDKTVNKGGIWRPSGIDVKGLVLKDNMKGDKLCSGMAKAELPFTNYLLQKQKKKYGMA